ncbi:MAG: hypothetical protein QRY74_04635 [Chlamydia sp.]
MKRTVLLLMIFLSFSYYHKREKEREKQLLIERCMKSASSYKKFSYIKEPLDLDLIKQPYLYIGKGKQARVFASLDGQHVLKIVRIPKQKKKRRSLFQSVYLAATELKDQTGLFFLQYSPLEEKKGPLVVTVLNERGKKEDIDLYSALFALQKRVPFPLKETLFRLQYVNRLEDGKDIVTSIFALLAEIRAKGIIDLDGALIRNGNIALLDENGRYKACIIDIGKFSKATALEITANDMKRLKPLTSWIESAWPELFSFYLQRMHEYREHPN